MRKSIKAFCAAIFAGLIAQPAMACNVFTGTWGCRYLGADPGTEYDPIEIRTMKVDGADVLYFGKVELGRIDGQWHDRKSEVFDDMVDRKTKVTCDANQLTIEETYREVTHNDADTWNDDVANAKPSGASTALMSSAPHDQRGTTVEGSGYLFIHQGVLYETGVRRSSAPDDSFVHVRICHCISR